MISRHSSKIWHLLRQRQAMVTYTLSPTVDLIVVCQSIVNSAKKNYEQISRCELTKNDAATKKNAVNVLPKVWQQKGHCR